MTAQAMDPVRCRDRTIQQGSCAVWHYDGANLPLSFSGGLRLGDAFIRELYGEWIRGTIDRSYRR